MNKQKDIILGCMTLGNTENAEPNYENEKKQAFKTLDAAVENGIKRFDHADIYGLGKSEKLFGRWLKANPGLRPEIEIQTKAGILLGQGYNGSNYYNSQKEYLKAQCNKSLENLQTDTIDIFMIHRPDPYTHPEEIAQSFREMKSAGMVKHFGVSNMSAAQMKTLQSAWGGKLKANQVQLSIGRSGIIRQAFFKNTEQYMLSGQSDDLLYYLLEQKAELQSWSPFDGGLYLKAPTKNDPPAIRETKQLLALTAEKHNCSKEAVALAPVFNLPLKTAAVIGTGNPKRIKNTLQALNIQLSRKEIYDLLIAALGEKLP